MFWTHIKCFGNVLIFILYYYIFVYVRTALSLYYIAWILNYYSEVVVIIIDTCYIIIAFSSMFLILYCYSKILTLDSVAAAICFRQYTQKKQMGENFLPLLNFEKEGIKIHEESNQTLTNISFSTFSQYFYVNVYFKLKTKANRL